MGETWSLKAKKLRQDEYESLHFGKLFIYCFFCLDSVTLRAKKCKHIKQFCMTSFSLHNVSKSLVNLLCSVLRNFTWIPKAQIFLVGLLMVMSQFSCSEKYVNFTGPETEELFIRILLECFSIVIFCLYW